MLRDAIGNPLHFEVTAGAVPDSGMALPLLEGRAAGHILADKGCIKPQLFDFIKKMKAKALYPAEKTKKCREAMAGMSTRKGTSLKGSSQGSSTSGGSPPALTSASHTTGGSSISLVHAFCSGECRYNLTS